MLSQTQGAPLVAGVIAFAAGFLVAAAFPPSQSEKDVVSDKLADKVEPIKAQLKQTGQEVAEHLKEPATDAVQSVKSAAQDAAQQVAGDGQGRRPADHRRGPRAPSRTSSPEADRGAHRCAAPGDQFRVPDSRTGNPTPS